MSRLVHKSQQPSDIRTNSFDVSALSIVSVLDALHAASSLGDHSGMDLGKQANSWMNPEIFLLTDCPSSLSWAMGMLDNAPPRTTWYVFCFSSAIFFAALNWARHETDDRTQPERCAADRQPVLLA